MCGSNFQASCTKLNVYIIVFNDRNYTAYQRNNHFFAAQPTVLHVVGVDTHGGISHDGFGTGGCYYGISSALFVTVNNFAFGSGFARHIVIGYIISQVIQFAVFFLIYHFFIAEGGQCLRVPVYHTHAAINQPFVVKVDKHLDNAFAAFFVHGEGCAVPVTRCTQLAELFQDDASVLVSPVPSVFQKLIAGEVGFFNALLSQFVHHFGFGGDGSMVCSRHPAGILSFHACTAYQYILNGIV